jgi:hypothetical protein
VTFTPKIRLWPGQSGSIDAGSWGLGVDISSYVRRPGQDGGQVISYSSGRQDEGNQIDAGTLNLTLDNRTGIWTPQNVNGTYYGLLKRNTPIQLSTDTGSDTFTRSVAAGLGTSSSGQAWTSSANWNVDGSAGYAAIGVNTIALATMADAGAYNFDIRYTCWVPVVATGASLAMAGAGRVTSATDAAIFRCEFNAAGTVDAKIGRRTASVSTTGSALAVFSYTANTKVRVRCVGDGQTMRMKIWKPANPATPDVDEPAAWNCTAPDSDSLGSGVGVFAWRFLGNTNAGTPNIYVDDFASAAEEWTGSVVQWPTRWSMTGANAWAPIQAGGVLRRLRQGQGQLQSPLRRQLAAYAPSGFWPLEDGPGATSLASAITGRQAATFEAVTPAGASDLAGATLAATFDEATSSILAKAPKPALLNPDGTLADGFAVMWLMKMSSLPGGTTRVGRIRASGRITRWDISMSDTGITLEGFLGGDATAIVTNSALYGTNINPLEWFAVQLEASYIGASTISYSLITHAVGDVTYYAQAGTYTGLVGIYATELQLGGTLLDGAAFSMIWIGPDSLPFVTDTFSLVSSGYAGELASARVARAADEAGVSVLVEPGNSEAMGAQKEGTILEVLRSCEAADYGILYETGSGLGFRPRTARYNPATALTLSLVAGHLSQAPEPIYDDQRLRNVWTISRVGGSSATVVDDASVALEGEVAGSDSINVESDEVLANHAGWRTYLGVQDELRWPSITLDFARNPSLLTYWRARRYGFRFAATTGLAQVTGAEPDVISEGYQAELWPEGWRVTLNCSGAAPWDVAVLESTTDPVRLDTAGSQLASSVTTTATSWSVATTAGPLWNPATTFPILMKCEGEIISVSAITGAVSPQTFTVTRSVNGVVKAHAAGAAVSLAYPSRLAL